MLKLYIDQNVIERLKKYFQENGQIKTIAVERILTRTLDIEEGKQD